MMIMHNFLLKPQDCNITSMYVLCAVKTFITSTLNISKCLIFRGVLFYKYPLLNYDFYSLREIFRPLAKKEICKADAFHGIILCNR